MKARHLNVASATGVADFIHADNTRRFWPVRATRPLQFSVAATRADGTVTEYTAIGGSSCDHIVDAMDLAGLGGVVRVRPLELEAA